MNTVSKKQRAIALLVEEISKKRLTIFVGAGCSISSGLPSWQDLINGLLEKYNIKTKETNLIRLASRLEREVGILEFREKIAERLQTRPDTSMALHDILISLDVNLFITTNYDHLLADSFRKQGLAPHIILNDKDLPTIDPTRKTIVKLHGDIDSATSLVITSLDYTRYKTMHQGFVAWLDNVVSQNTLLFLGSSFDDPRLREADEHVIRIFDKNRRQPFILLKKPAQSLVDDEQFEIELADFEALCEDFEERGFFVITIENYDDIPLFLKEIREKVLNQKLKERMADGDYRLILLADNLGALQKTLSILLDEKTSKLIKSVTGDGRLPTPQVMVDRAETLIRHLENPEFPLSPEAQVEGWLTVADAYLQFRFHNNLYKARDFYDKANSIFQNVSDKEKWAERLIRLRAKLLYYEGKFEEAIESLSKSTDNKTISHWLALLLDSQRLDEAYEFVSTHKIDPAWVCMALYTLVFNGHVQQAEELFLKAIDELEASEKIRKIKTLPLRNKHSLEEMCFVMAESLFYQATKLTGRQKFIHIFPIDLTEDAKNLCRMALSYVDRLFHKFPKQDLPNRYFAAMTIQIEMMASWLLQEWQRSDKCAQELLTVKPISKEVTRHIVSRKEFFSNDIIIDLISRLEEDHPKEFWAFLAIADLEAFPLKNKDKSWMALQRAVDLVVSIEDKREVTEAAFVLGAAFNLVDEAHTIINNLLQDSDILRQLFNAFYFQTKGDSSRADDILAELENQQPTSEISAAILNARAEKAIEEKQWDKARDYLEESYKIYRNPHRLKTLLFVMTKLQDHTGALKISEELESLGLADDHVMEIKAQAAQILGQLEKSEKAWRLLANKYPEKPENAFGWANVLFVMSTDNSDMAFKVLEPFIMDQNKIHLDCLRLATVILEIKEKYSEAFHLLEKNHDKFDNNPDFLIKHLDLGHRTGHEEEAHRSLLKLEVLRQEGKVSESSFARVSMEKMVEIIKQSKESYEKLKELYKLGQIPRFILCQQRNMPLYLDWAVRTQELVLPLDPGQWIDYTIYSTNGLRVEFSDGRNQLVPINAPQDIEEIVIDYHALITLHRLGLLEKLGKRYSKIYYPAILKIIWATDQKKFGHHQISKEKVYRKLNERLQSGQIREFLAPEPLDDSDFRNETPLKRNLRLARLENFLLIDSYVKKEDLTEFPDVMVIRLAQLVEWLYTRGKLGEKKYQEMQRILGGLPEIINKDSGRSFDNSNQFLIEETTLEQMEQHDLIKILRDAGIQLIVERATANYIRHAVFELDFGERVGDWHRDLVNSIKRLEFFKEIHASIRPNDKDLLKYPYIEAATAPVRYAEENSLFLLTDDRWTQMIRSHKFANRQFGVDALLKDLYERDIISLEDYATCFIQLCQWRYRFLIPDVSVMVFLIKQYKIRPLGKDLTMIADYGRKCMEDQGLFWSMELTEPPMPLGLKFHMAWVSRWVDFLVAIWLDGDFTDAMCEVITQKVYQQSIPFLPKHIKNEIRRSYATVDDKSVIKQLFHHATFQKEPIRLHGLLTQTFETFGYDEKRSLSELKAYLDLIKENQEIKKYKKQLKILASRVLLAFYGEAVHQRGVHNSLIPLLEEMGFHFTKGQSTISKKQTDELVTSSTHVTSSLFEQRDLIRKSIPEYIPEGPLLIIAPSEEKDVRVFMPHQFILSPNRADRIAVVKDIMKHNYVSDHTKKIIEKNNDSILSGYDSVWRPAVSDVSYALLRDFRYACSLFSQTSLMANVNIPGANPALIKTINETWNYAMTPDLETVIGESPFIFENPLEIEVILQRIEKEMAGKSPTVEEGEPDPLTESLNWYLKNIYFIPVRPPWNPWSIITQSLLFFRNSGKPKEQIKTIEKKMVLEVFHNVKEWLKDKKDPLAYLMALDLALNARARVSEEEKFYFTESSYYEFLDHLFEALISPEEDTLPTGSKMLRAIWQMRHLLAQYYLKYIDLNDKSNMQEEKRVALAWWMAREVETSILKSIKLFKEHDQIDWIKDKVQEVIETKDDLISITHLFEDAREFYSIIRYRNLYSLDLLTLATVSMLMPVKNKDIDGRTAFDGLKHPTTALSPELRDVLIEKLVTQLGDAQVSQNDRNPLPLLWNISLCVSLPTFLKAYYGDAIDLLGREKVQVLEVAEYFTDYTSLTEELIKLPQYIKDKQGALASIILASLKVLVFTQGKMPEAAKIFQENEILAKSLGELDVVAGTFCLPILAQILVRLQQAGNLKWAQVIGKQFLRIDYAKCSELTLEPLMVELIKAVLLGADYTVLKPILDRIAFDKRIRKVLGKIKSWIEYVFPRVPGSFRDNIRRVLHDLEDVPVLEK